MPFDIFISERMQHGTISKKLHKLASTKNDALVTVEPIASGIEIELTSKVIRQYGDQIKSVILNTVKEAGYDGVKVIVQDKNAWDYN